jgi:hypothetical protein
MCEFDQDQRQVVERLHAAQKRLEAELKAADEKDRRESIERVLRAVRKMIEDFTKPARH